MHDRGTLIYRLGPFTLWHYDPCTDGSDDSCGWFMRARHGNEKVLEGIYQDILFDWHCAYQPLFATNGEPALSTIGITLNMFFHGAYRHFNSREKAVRWMQRNLTEILFFAENPVDTMATSIQGKYGEDKEPKEERARRFAGVIYGWILRHDRPWWKHPRWHIHHWRLKCYPFWKRINQGEKAKLV